MTSATDAIEQIRKIRGLEDPKLKPSPFLKDTFVNEWGEEGPVVLRDYQVRGIMNLLQVPRMVLGDDTGLGKTLEVLSAIGYVWLKEPHYVPVIISKKSALFQWEAETRKFMKDMEAVTIDGEPFERHAMYEDFFLEHDPSRKRLLILTYDRMLKDMEEQIIRDRTKKAPLKIRKAGKAARKIEREAKKDVKNALEMLEGHFKKKPPSWFKYLKERSAEADPDAPQPKPPAGWSQHDEDHLIQFVDKKKAFREAKAEADRLRDLEAPPTRVPGILSCIAEMQARHPEARLMFVLDEAHVLKNYKSKMHKAAAGVAERSDRVVAMTATPVKNRLMEFFGLLRIVVPSLFPKVTHFQESYCIIKWQKIPGNRRVPVVVGHSNAQLERFVAKVEPYYLSRRKHEVAKELPELITRELRCELTPKQEELYDLAEAGLLEEGDEDEESTAEILGAMVKVQQACNACALVKDEDGNPFDGPSSKIDILREILREELAGVKTIIFSRFEQMISLIEEALIEDGVKYVRITGKEAKASQREEAKAAFQDLQSGVDIVMITTAGTESINLHAAEQIVFVDSPWSWGDYVQGTGRFIRLGSQHKSVVATHLVAVKRNGSTTMDHYVIKTLRGKKKLADKVAGESLKGGLDFTEANEAMDIFKALRADREASDPDARRKVVEGSRRSAKKEAETKAKLIQASPPKPKDPDDVPAFLPDYDFSDV